MRPDLVSLCAGGNDLLRGADPDALARRLLDAVRELRACGAEVLLFTGVDVLVTDCLRREAHPTHASLALAIDLAQRCGARQTVLTHLDKSMDYRAVSREVPEGVLVGYDGMVLVA